ncbi:MAG: M23 family metallopeptidase [Lachnospiraceae bacterium]
MKKLKKLFIMSLGASMMVTGMTGAVSTKANTLEDKVSVYLNNDFIGYAESDTVAKRAYALAQYGLRAENQSELFIAATLTTKKATVEVSQDSLSGIGDKIYAYVKGHDDIMLTHAYSVKVNKKKVVFATKEEVVSFLETAPAKKSATYKVELLEKEKPEKTIYKPEIQPAEESQAVNVVSMSFKQPVKINEDIVQMSDLTTVEDAVDEVKVTVVTQKEAIYKKAYQAKTVYKKTNKLYEGQQKTVRKAKKGTKFVTALVTYEDGKEVGREVISSDIVEESVAKKVLVGTKENKSFITPVDNPNISSRFGPRWGRMHKGIDFSLPVGNPIYASRSGKVSYAGWMSGYGYVITVDHGDNMQSRYAHLNKINVSVGQTVTQGECIAQSGNTGYSTGPHLHFEILKNGTQVNPESYLN